MIDPQDTIAFIQTRDGRGNLALPLWLARFYPSLNVLVAKVDDRLECARNQVAEKFLNCFGKKQLILFDDDMEPDERARPLFEVEADVVGCTYESSPNAWMQPTDVHCGALRISREVLAALEPPYFQFGYDAGVTRTTGCECNYFRDKVLAAGFSIVRAGYCQNHNTRSWCGR